MKKKYIRRWEVNHGRKVYYLCDPYLSISICNVSSKRRAEKLLKRAQKEFREYVADLLT